MVKKYSTSSVTKNAPLILEKLATVYPNAKCELVFHNPFELLVATILSAQCTDRQVNLVTPQLFAIFPDSAALATANPTKVEEIIKPTGFFRRKASLLINLGQKLIAEFGGEVPNNMPELLTLPGVGRKTANVVLGNCFAVPGLTIDTHFSRLARHWGWSYQTDPNKIEVEVAKLVPQISWTDTSHRVIAHGRTVCHARRPACGACFLQSECLDYGVGETEEIKAAALVKGPWKDNVLRALV